MTNDVVITGLGVVSPMGNDLESFWERLLYTESLPIDYPYKHSRYMSNRRAYLVQDRDLVALVEKSGARPGRATSFALSATEMALQDAGLLAHQQDSVVGVCLGTGTGDSDLLEDEREGGTQVDPLATFSFGAAAVVADHFQIMGPNVTVSTACSAGCYSLSLACDMVRDGQADAMIVGGTETISRVGQACFNRIDGLDPWACRPFDKDRAGTVYGEGAAILILESKTHAQQRGQQHYYAEVKGYGWSCDGYHPTAPDPMAQQSELAMQRAFTDAKLTAAAIDCLICHGTGTELNDLAESKCLETVFEQRLAQLSVCAIKSKLGHSGGAAGAFSCLVAALILEQTAIPPTANLETVDPHCRLNLHTGQPIQKSVQNVLVNAYAFGGNNISIVLGKGSHEDYRRF